MMLITKIRTLLFSLLLSASSGMTLYSQTIISGTIKDESGKPAPNINILIYNQESDALIAFGITNQQGNFRISVNSAADSLRLDATSIQFRNERIILANTSQELEIVLVPDVKDLSEFVVRAAPIEKRGDTISYLVSSFAREQDRSIADVLDKMPGIEVEPSGRILYQGDPIQHLYVEGLDLMGGRYGLVTQNLPHRSVATVQILENHQPIRILEERAPSYRASLNITLKRQVTTTGTARLGSGLTPVLWEANTTPMMFTPNFQLAGSYQANNTGNDASRQLNTLTMEGLRDRMENSISRSSTLGIPAVSPPGFNQNRFLRNNLHMANTNALLRLNNDMQLRTNLYYIYDYQQQNGNISRRFFTPTDTLSFTEQSRNQLYTGTLKGEATLSRNTKDNYLNNKLEFQWMNDHSTGNIMGNGSEALNQQLSNPFLMISNRLSMVKPVAGKLVQFISFIQYDHSPHNLMVMPGRYTETIGGIPDADQTLQKLQQRRFNSNHSASISHRWGRWNLTPRVGFQYLQNERSSSLNLFSGSQELTGLFINQSNGFRTRTYLQTEITYRRNSNFSVTTDIPFSHVYINITDNNLDRGQQISRFLPEPRVSASYRFANFWQARGSYGISFHFGDIDEVYYHWIMRNFRSLHVNDAPLQQSQRHNFSGFLGYRNPIRGFFSSVNYAYGINQNNLLISQTINTDGTTVAKSLERPNTSYMHNLNGRVSQFIGFAGTTVTLQGSYIQNIRQQWVNESIFTAINNIYSFTPRLSTKFTEWLSGEGRMELLFYDTYRGNEKINQVSIRKYFGNIVVFPAKNQHISLEGEYYGYQDRINYFFDLSYRYTIRQRRIDIDIRWVNILNHKTYHDFVVGPYSLIETEYQLRPSQLVATVRFSF